MFQSVAVTFDAVAPLALTVTTIVEPPSLEETPNPVEEATVAAVLCVSVLDKTLVPSSVN